MKKLKMAPTVPQQLRVTCISNIILIFQSRTGSKDVQVDICRRRWQISRATPDKWHMEVSPYAHWVFPRKVPRDKWSHSTQEPTVLEATVEGTVTKQSSGTDGTPNHTCCVENFLTRACVHIGLSIGAAKESVILAINAEEARGKASYQTSGIFSSAQFITAICTIADQMLATSCAENIVRGGTFI